MWLQNVDFFLILLCVLSLVDIFTKLFKLIACIDGDFYELLL
jgi:hypothetical protein